MKRLTVTLLLALVGATPALAQEADSATAAVAAAQSAAESWLVLIDERRYGESWDQAAAPFRAAVPRAEWERAVAQARRPVDPLGERRLLNATYTTSLPNAPPGRYVVLQYETEAAGDRAVVETIAPMQASDGTWRVSGYYIRPR